MVDHTAPLPPVGPSTSFTSFGFKWPPLLTKMYNVASMSSFNEQFLAPECSIGTWGFQLKCVRL